MVRFLFFLVNMLAVSRPGGTWSSRRRARDPYDWDEEPDDGDTWIVPPPEPAPRSAWPRQQPWPREPPAGPAQPPRTTGRAPRQGISRKLKWAAVLIVTALIFRKVIAWAVLVALAAALHLVGLNVHLPHVKLSWPWQSITAGTTTNTDVGPWVLQKIEGISRPALGGGERRGDASVVGAVPGQLRVPDHHRQGVGRVPPAGARPLAGRLVIPPLERADPGRRADAEIGIRHGLSSLARTVSRGSSHPGGSACHTDRKDTTYEGDHRGFARNRHHAGGQ